MKNCTSIEQSKKLAEILPLESADMLYEGWQFSQDYIDTPIVIEEPRSEIKWKHRLPCWSLAALLDVLKNPMLLKHDGFWHIYNEDIKCLCFDNSIDACYEMILKLNKEGLL